MTQQEAALAGLCVAYVVTSKDDPSLTQTHTPIMWWWEFSRENLPLFQRMVRMPRNLMDGKIWECVFFFRSYALFLVTRTAHIPSNLSRWVVLGGKKDENKKNTDDDGVCGVGNYSLY